MAGSMLLAAQIKDDPMFALVTDCGAVIRVSDGAAPPPLAPEKGLRWLPLSDTRPEAAADEILEGPETVVATDAVRRVWRTRPLTHGERLARCHAARRAAYPPLGDQLDAAYKARQGDPAALEAIDAAIAAVKAAHPKPAAG